MATKMKNHHVDQETKVSEHERSRKSKSSLRRKRRAEPLSEAPGAAGSAFVSSEFGPSHIHISDNCVCHI